MLSPRCTLLFVLHAAAAPLLFGQKGLPEPRAALAFQPPKGWVELPAVGDRAATVRLFAAPNALADKGEGKHTPLLRVMFFAKGGSADNDVVDGLPRETPFRGLEDFCKRGLGSKNVEKTAQKAAGVDGESVTANDVPGDRVVFGQTVPGADGEAAVCIEVINNQADKVKKEFEAVAASLEPLPHAAAPRPTPPWSNDGEWQAKDAAARTAARRQWAEQVVAASTKNPEAGFKVSKAKWWTVLSNADAAFTKKATTAAEAAREWLAKKAPELTKDAPLPAVLRVFATIDQYKAFASTRTDSREYDQLQRELYVVDDRDNGGVTGWGQTLRAVLWHAFDDVDAGVLPAMPRWLDNGLWEFLRSSKFDGKKLEFFGGDVEKGRIDWYRQNNTEMLPLWDLMQEKKQPSPTDGTMEKEWGYTPECARLVRWLWMQDGQKAFDKPALLADYVKAIGKAHTKIGRDPTADVPAIGLSESEQKERNTRYYKWRDAVLVATNDTAVPLQVDAWKAVNVKWLEFNKSFK